MNDPTELVRVYSGPLELVQSYASMLTEKGIQSRTVGGELTSGIGTVLPGSIELWVHRSSLDKARDLIEKKPHKSKHDHPDFPHPTDQKIPPAPPRGKEHYVNPNPASN